MRLRRRSLLSTAASAAALVAVRPASAATTEKFTVLLDWFVNPDHAPLFTARYIGAFARAGLDVDLVAPTDPDVPPRLLAAGKADVALSYQTQLYLLVDQGLPVRRTGTLIGKPLNTLTALGGRGITKLADLKGKKVGYSVAGVEDVLISTMLHSVGLTLRDVTLINVNFALVTALMSHQVDAVIGTYRTYEDIQLRQAGLHPVLFYPEDYGVPASEELIIMSNAAALNNPALPKFMAAVQEGANYLVKNPDAMWEKFATDQPTLNDKLDKTSWFALLPYFAQNPAFLDEARYTTYRDFMFKNGLIKKSLPLSDYAVQITT
jgi:putative hydroxymethylpyrimidine transport system substrate-binding protein